MLDRSTLYQIFELLPSPAIILLPDAPVYTIVDLNSGYVHLSASTKEQLIGRGFFDYFEKATGKDMSDDAGILNKVIQDKLPHETAVQRYEVPVPGTQIMKARYFRTTNVPVLNSDNEVAYIIRSVTEATENVAIKQKQERTKKNLKEASMLMSQGQELANFGNWQWDIINNKVSWTETLYHIYGLDKASFNATFEGYQQLLHPDDRERVYNHITEVLQTKRDVVFEERIIRPDGEIRYLKSWGKVQVNEQGKPVKMIGACLDITDHKLAEASLKNHFNAIEQQNKHLQDIAWIQSHIIRAPLARIMGLIELFKSYKSSEIDKNDLLDNILISAKELDGIIKDVTYKTENIVKNSTEIQ